MMKRYRIPALLAALALFLFPAAAEEAPETTWEPISFEEDASPNVPAQENYGEDGLSYHDDSLDVRVETFRAYDTTVMAVYVTVADASQLRTGTAAPWPSARTSPAAVIAKNMNAVVAINGDYFVYHNQGIVVRNGKLLRDRPIAGRETLIIDENGDFHVLAPTTQEAFDAFEGTVMQAFCFGPGLVHDGYQLTDYDQTNMDIGKHKLTQRTAIGQLGEKQYVLLTCEGPENKDSVGMDIVQWAQVCADVGCTVAYNLDGGSSSSIVLNNEKINALSSGKSRSVGDIIYFATLIPGE